MRHYFGLHATWFFCPDEGFPSRDRDPDIHCSRSEWALVLVHKINETNQVVTQLSEQSQRTNLMLFGGVANQFHSSIREKFPDIEIVLGSRRNRKNANYANVDVIVGWRFPRGIFNDMPNLRWIQSIAVGVDEWVHDSAIPSDVLITNAKGVYADSIAEYVIWSLLTLSRRFHITMKNQVKRCWSQSTGDGLRHKVLGVAGLGSVGHAVACRAKAFDMRTVGIVREAGESMCSHVDEIVPFSNMESILGDLDAIVLCLPLTEQSRGLFGNHALSMMKRGAIIVNIAREGVTDYSAIVERIKDGHLAGAALDTFDKEPLSRWSKLWRIENLLITPHVSALTSDYKKRVVDLISDNIARFEKKQTLRNLVDRVKGY